MGGRTLISDSMAAPSASRMRAPKNQCKIVAQRSARARAGDDDDDRMSSISEMKFGAHESKLFGVVCVCVCLCSVRRWWRTCCCCSAPDAVRSRVTCRDWSAIVTCKLRRARGSRRNRRCRRPSSTTTHSWSNEESYVESRLTYISGRRTA